MQNKPIIIRNVVQAAHLILMGYGHWLANDPRGSGSTEIRNPKLKQLGPIHFGRKRSQPSRKELKAFHQSAAPMLAHKIIWFDEKMRNVIAEAIEQVAREAGYTIWALAILTNHIHLVIRTHRDDSLTMLTKIAQATHKVLHSQGFVPPNHPVWSDRPYKVYLKTKSDVYGRISYVKGNPAKEGLPPQNWAIVSKCTL